MIKNRDHLLAFGSVARLGTVHAAAAELGIVQTAVTQRIKAAESELGVTLFLRSRRGMSLTEEGKVLLRYLTASQELEGQYSAQLRGERRREVSATILGPVSAISTRIAADCVPLYVKFPFLRFHLRSEEQGSRLDRLKRGEADLAIVAPAQVPNEMDSKLLKSDRYLLVGSPQWKGRKLAEVLASERIIDFDAQDPTTTQYLERFSLDRHPTRDRLYVNENAALIRYFAAGIGFGTLTESVAKPYLERGELIALNQGAALEDPLALVWYPRPHRADYFDAIVRAIK